MLVSNILIGTFGAIGIIFIGYSLNAIIKNIFCINDQDNDLFDELILSISYIFSLILMLQIMHTLSNGLLFKSNHIIMSMNIIIISISFILNWKKINLTNILGYKSHINKIIFFICNLLFITIVLNLSIKGKYIFWGDYIVHIGYTNELLLGNVLPSGPYINVPNQYPWYFHSVIAYISKTYLLDAFDSLIICSYLRVMLFYLTLYKFISYYTPNLIERASIINFIMLYSGFQSVSLLEGGRFGITLSIPLNMAGLSRPREFSLVLLLLSMVLLYNGLFLERGSFMKVFSVVAGINGLLHPTSLFILLIFTLISYLYVYRDKYARYKNMLISFGVILIIFSLWFIPVIYNRADFGSLEHTSLSAKVEIPISDIIWSLGVIPMLTVYYIYAFIFRENGGQIYNYSVIIMISTLLPLACTYLLYNVLPSGFSTLLQSYRWYNYLVFISSICAGVALIHVMKVIKNRMGVLSVVLIFLFLLSGLGPLFEYSSRFTVLNENRNSAFDMSTVKDMNEIKNAYNINSESIFLAPPEVSETLYWLTGAHVFWVNRPRLRWSQVFNIIPDQQIRDHVEWSSYVSSFNLTDLNRYGITNILLSKNTTTSYDLLNKIEDRSLVHEIYKTPYFLLENPCNAHVLVKYVNYLSDVEPNASSIIENKGFPVKTHGITFNKTQYEIRVASLTNIGLDSETNKIVVQFRNDGPWSLLIDDHEIFSAVDREGYNYVSRNFSVLVYKPEHGHPFWKIKIRSVYKTPLTVLFRSNSRFTNLEWSFPYGYGIQLDYKATVGEASEDNYLIFNNYGGSKLLEYYTLGVHDITKTCFYIVCIIFCSVISLYSLNLVLRKYGLRSP